MMFGVVTRKNQREGRIVSEDHQQFVFDTTKYQLLPGDYVEFELAGNQAINVARAA